MNNLLKAGFVAALAMLATSASAQGSSSQCTWVGNTWTCNSQRDAGVDWRMGVIKSPDFMGAFEAGEEARRREVERRAAITPPVMPRPGAAVSGSAIPADYLDRWYVAARPRMGLYPDFETKVYSAKVDISPAVVWLMSTSPYAADIAYYLATHKAEAAAISSMPLANAGRAIDQIAAEFAKGQPPSP